ncbi:MAG: FAD-dependent oxidoreductase [Phascolarctobacterium sp.]|nr:FAD-dependent oxidoreductase [Phascolarctobacterium sp.]
MAIIVNPTASEFKKMLATKKTFLADFYATWCGPCKMLSYVLEDIDKLMCDKIDIVKIDIDKEPELTESMDIEIIPALFFIKDGEIASRYAGFLPKERLIERLEKLLGNEPPVEMAPAKDYDLIIIGGGAAGLTAAIYARRAGLKTLVLESFAPGGKLIKTFELENWPGIKNVNGSQLAYDIYAQAMALGTTYLYEKVIELKSQDKLHTVSCESGIEFSAPAVIIATGTVERLLNIPGETEMIGRGISFCAVCDAAFYRNKPVVIVGAGNAAFEESLYLAEFASKVTILARRDVISAEQITQEKVAQHPKIEVLTWRVPQEVIIENNRVAGLKVLNKVTGEMEIMRARGVFPYIGADPVTDFCRTLDITDLNGYLLVKNDMATAIPGIFGAGDVCDKVLRQVVTATNDGAIAAQSALHYIRNLE